MTMPTREFSTDAYRYAFNGKENDKDFGNDQLVQDYGFRIYNPAIGRFLSVDPLSSSYPWYTPYQFAGNKPIAAIDLDGLEEKYVFDSWYWTDEFMKMVDEGELTYSVVEKAREIHTRPYWREQDFEYAQRVFGASSNQVATYIPNKDPNRNGETEIWGRYLDEEKGSYMLIKIISAGGNSDNTNYGFDFYLWQDRLLKQDGIRMPLDPNSWMEGNDDGGVSTLVWTNPDGTMGAGQKLVWSTLAIEGAIFSMGYTTMGLVGAVEIKTGTALVAAGQYALDGSTLVTNLFGVGFYEYLQATGGMSAFANAKNMTNPVAFFGLMNDLVGLYNNYKEEQIKEKNRQENQENNNGKNEK